VDAPPQESLMRGKILDTAALGGEPDADFLEAVMRTPPPDGVRRDGTNGDRLVTCCTVVLELAVGEVRITTDDGHARTSVSDLVPLAGWTDVARRTA
jgi:hypothetical protein